MTINNTVPSADSFRSNDVDVLRGRLFVEKLRIGFLQPADRRSCRSSFARFGIGVRGGEDRANAEGSVQFDRRLDAIRAIGQADVHDRKRGLPAAAMDIASPAVAAMPMTSKLASRAGGFPARALSDTHPPR
ncbi:hypothetical protein HFN62_21795 [Rhizobium leguminosarum]|uniref:hypothetical protein n=1 Tax=Rhizobium leguminosarum TaxID=384 RepID=UPI001C96ED2C|nr:hypothetical protein [Rhizobium leguminosarum]MBY5786349.1 hypothetical protein [Rhizobium leguminosarum]